MSSGVEEQEDDVTVEMPLSLVKRFVLRKRQTLLNVSDGPGRGMLPCLIRETYQVP